MVLVFGTSGGDYAFVFPILFFQYVFRFLDIDCFWTPNKT